jgi:hypothetical protein
MVPSARSAVGNDARGPSCDDWTETEVAAATFADTRLHRRFADLLWQLAAGVGTTIPQAYGDRTGVKAAPKSERHTDITKASSTSMPR